MPEPATVLLGGAALLLALALVSLSRVLRLRRHIDESASAVADERRRRDSLVSTLRHSGPAVEVDAPASQDPAEAEGLSEQVEEAEDRLAAVNRLYTAQVRAWNRLGHASLWGRLRRLTGWRPMPEPPAEGESSAAVRDDEPA